jgi:hypothetical protein
LLPTSGQGFGSICTGKSRHSQHFFRVHHLLPAYRRVVVYIQPLSRRTRNSWASNS